MTGPARDPDDTSLPSGLEQLLREGRDVLASELSTAFDIEAGLAAIVGTRPDVRDAPSRVAGAGTEPGATAQRASGPGRIATRSGYQPSPDSGLDENGRIVGWGAERTSPHTSLLFFLADRIPRGDAGDRATLLQDYPRHAYGLVMLIEECSGIQVGDGNEQLSVYRVTVPVAALAAAPELAGLLLAADTPWSRDVFGHDAELPPVPAGQPDRDSRAIVPGPGGNVLVIVRNSRGVQVGDGNVQRNLFRIRVAAVSVWLEGVELTRARRDAVTRLHEDPKDRNAAHFLAADIAGAASASLQADLRARLSQEVGDPHVSGQPEELIGQTGRQVGAHGRARVEVEVEDVTVFDVEALSRELTDAAEYISTLEAALAETPEAKTVESPSAIDRNLWRLPPPSSL